MIKDFVKQWKNDIKDKINKLPQKPILGIVQVGHNPASDRYVRNKMKDCEEVGIITKLLNLSEKIDLIDFSNALTEFQLQCDGVIVQLPLPTAAMEEKAKKMIYVSRDVDGFNYYSKFDPCTPKGIIKWLEFNNFDFEGKNAVIIGRSDIVGKPMARMLLDKNMTITICHSHTKNLEEIAKTAEVLVCAVGKPHFLDCSIVKDDCIVIDVGINFVDGKLVGDCYNTEGKNVTPVPGGVGLLTRCALLDNVLKTKLED